jgi:hypothetical protein
MKLKMDLASMFHHTERIIYIFISLILTVSALFLVYEELKEFFRFRSAGDTILWIVEIISKSLLLLMIVEILYTVRVSVKNMALSAEPFLIVALIAGVRRILLLSVETAYLPEKFTVHMIEMGVLGFLLLIFVVAIVLLRKNCRPSV